MKSLELKPHQSKAIDELNSGKILVGDVGAGKTRTAVAYYLAKEAPRDVYVITTAKVRDGHDWEDEFIKIGVSRDDPAATHHGVLRVDSWNNIQKYVDVKDAFFIFDEQRLVGSGAWTKSFYKIAKANRWILLSATPGDTWMDYIPVMVANGFYKNKTEFIRRHVVYSPFSKFPKVQRYLESGVLVRHRNRIQVLMPFERHTTRHIHNVVVDYDAETMRKVMVDKWNIFEEVPLKDIADLFRVARKLVNSDPSRLNTVRSLLEKHPRLIVFYNFDYELEALRTLSSEAITSQSQTRVSTTTSTEPSSLVIAEWNGHKHDPVPTTDRWVYLVQYTAGAEGWNCITTDAMCFYSLPYSYKIWHQAHGRIDRLNTLYFDLHYYVLESKSWIDQAIRKSLRGKKSFNEASWGRKAA